MISVGHVVGEMMVFVSVYCMLLLVFHLDDDTVAMDVGLLSGHRICGQLISIRLSWLLFAVGLLLLLLMVHVMVLY